MTFIRIQNAPTQAVHIVRQGGATRYADKKKLGYKVAEMSKASIEAMFISATLTKSSTFICIRKNAMKTLLLAATLLATLPAFAKTVWIDVRTLEEFAQGHVQHATNLPLSNNFVQQAQRTGLAKDDVVLLYCRSGHRAGLAQEALKKAGYSKAQNLGGFADLKASNAVKTTP